MGGDWNWAHVLVSFCTGTVAFGVLAHAVNTFPVPDNEYARWLLGVLQYWIGQKERGGNTIKNQDTITVAVPKKNGNGG
jgi:hypothetical protein